MQRRWRIPVEPTGFTSALTIDEDCQHAIWLYHVSHLDDEEFDMVKSTIMQLPLDAANSANSEAIRAIPVFWAKSEYPLLHCDIIAAKNPTQSILVAQKYSTLAFILQFGEEEGATTGISTRDSFPVTNELNPLPSEGCDDQSQESTSKDLAWSDPRGSNSWAMKNVKALNTVELGSVIKWGIDMRYCPSPSLARRRGTRVKLELNEMPEQYSSNASITQSFFFQAGDSAFGALVRGYGVPGLPSPSGYCVPGIGMLAGIPFDGYSLIYDIEEGEWPCEWSVDVSTRMDGSGILSPSTPIPPCCQINMDNMRGDRARALDQEDAVRFNDANKKIAALFRFGLNKTT
ncbi:hypothetical protein DACRYDRAFT_116067 [Dacryopinax primogenitus]|uniref:Uncharacterized protein n=1 Tax=Dacryopinax primogenitus (strain DJM 731) TaxID=1858805 RepID=M5FWN0_DACPD|nr:uncharacterized protein DACRYDRAFT_116067 [Dacryopinax primogenitus]EJU02356.1 hypothetical protein DACRYDRAFT_116067 [Dacryopinax primogenitus]